MQIKIQIIHEKCNITSGCEKCSGQKLREAGKREGLEQYLGWSGNAALRKHQRGGLEGSKATNCVDMWVKCQHGPMPCGGNMPTEFRDQ